MSMRNVDPDGFYACCRCEDYYGGLAAIKGVLRTHGAKGDTIRIDLSDTETAHISSTRMWQYYFEREEQQAKSSERKRIIEVAAIVFATAFLTAFFSDWLPSIICNLFDQ